MIDTSKIKGKIEYCLDKWPKCRDDDQFLYACLCATFWKQCITEDVDGDKCIKLRYIELAPNLSTVIRVRQKFQEAGLYEGTKENRQKRWFNELRMRREMRKSITNVDL